MRVQYLKHPSRPHWSHDPMVVLGEDRWGVWLGATPATRFTKPDPVDPDGRPLHDFLASHPMVQLVPHGEWWTLIRNAGSRLPWYIDIVTPPVFADDVIEMVDLDLDVVRDGQGEVAIDDEDEFEIHRIALAYPPRWVDAARGTAARLHLALDALADPFGAAADAWLATLATRDVWR